MKKAFRKRYDFAPNNPERYLIFLKEHFTKTDPKFYSVISKEKVDTSDGVMFYLELADDIENPDHDTIAECIINGESIYLWRDHCWGIAVDKNGIEIKIRKATGLATGFTYAEPNRNKKRSKAFDHHQEMILFKIGSDPVE